MPSGRSGSGLSVPNNGLVLCNWPLFINIAMVAYINQCRFYEDSYLWFFYVEFWKYGFFSLDRCSCMDFPCSTNSIWPMWRNGLRRDWCMRRRTYLLSGILNILQYSPSLPRYVKRKNSNNQLGECELPLATVRTGCPTFTNIGSTCILPDYATFTPPCPPTPDCIILSVTTQPCSCGGTIATTTYCPSKCPPAACGTELEVKFACPTPAPITTMAW
jgi:hypothetical protein